MRIAVALLFALAVTACGDDARRVSRDGGLADARLEPPVDARVDAAKVDARINTCGNGSLEPGEECDTGGVTQACGSACNARTFVLTTAPPMNGTSQPRSFDIAPTTRGWVAVFTQFGPDVTARLFDRRGVPELNGVNGTTDDFAINRLGEFGNATPIVVGLGSEDGFVAGWSTSRDSGTRYDTHLQRFGPDGVPRSANDEVLVSSGRLSGLARLSSGDLAVASLHDSTLSLQRLPATLTEAATAMATMTMTIDASVVIAPSHADGLFVLTVPAAGAAQELSVRDGTMAPIAPSVVLPGVRSFRSVASDPALVTGVAAGPGASLALQRFDERGQLGVGGGVLAGQVTGAVVCAGRPGFVVFWIQYNTISFKEELWAQWLDPTGAPAVPAFAPISASVQLRDSSTRFGSQLAAPRCAIAPDGSVFLGWSDFRIVTKGYLVGSQTLGRIYPRSFTR